jgi:general secretion pathway protein N
MSATLARVGARRLALVALCALLVAVIALELSPRPGIPQAEAGVAKAAPPGPLVLPSEPAVLPPLQQYAAVVERPLFHPSRRPPAEASATPAVAADLRQLTLTAVIITPEKRLAIFQDKSPAQNLRLTQGMRVGEWTLDEIKPDSVIFRRGAARQRLALYEAKDHPPATADGRLAAARAAAKEQAQPGGAPRRKGPRRLR